jgi:hypothetical protein
MADVAFIRPEGDDTEKGLSGIAHFVQYEMSTCLELFADVSVVDLSGSGVTPAAVDSLGPNVSSIVYLGHGKPDAFGYPTPLTDLSSLHHLRDRVVIGLCCSAAEQLGPEACDAGARAFIGFADLLAVILRSSWWALPFERAITGLLMPDGTAGEAHGALREGLAAQRDAFMPGGPNENHRDAPVIWLAALANRATLRLIGDPDAAA